MATSRRALGDLTARVGKENSATLCDPVARKRTAVRSNIPRPKTKRTRSAGGLRARAVNAGTGTAERAKLAATNARKQTFNVNKRLQVLERDADAKLTPRAQPQCWVHLCSRRGVSVAWL